MNVVATACHLLLAWPPWRERGTFRLPPPVLMLVLFAPDIIEGVEDVDTVLESVLLGTLQPFRIDHAQHLVVMLVFPIACIPDDIPPGDAADLLAEAEHRVDVRLEMSPTVPSERELVGVDVDVLGAQAMESAVAPTFEVGKNAMYPRKRHMGGRRIFGAQVYRGMLTIRHLPIGGIAVGDYAGAD